MPGPADAAAAQSELIKDVAKGGAPAAVLLGLGWFLLGQLQAIQVEMGGMRDELTAIKVENARASAGVWHSVEQKAHEAEIQAQLRALESRLSKVESSR